MNAALPLLAAALLVPLALPPAAADHAATCGAADGTVVEGLALWLRPGCLGAVVYVPDCDSSIVVFHGTVVGVLGFSNVCATGVWLP
ncbi:MAG TPA: hypothetical protein VNX21_06685 [Candidatus Thermoplasmatota archaeon]|nr:hypothetical protein [Candidatus Thermoplasmatota archaeon]